MILPGPTAKNTMSPFCDLPGHVFKDVRPQSLQSVFAAGKSLSSLGIDPHRRDHRIFVFSQFLLQEKLAKGRIPDPHSPMKDP